MCILPFYGWVCVDGWELNIMHLWISKASVGVTIDTRRHYSITCVNYIQKDLYLTSLHGWQQGRARPSQKAQECTNVLQKDDYTAFYCENEKCKKSNLNQGELITVYLFTWAPVRRARPFLKTSAKRKIREFNA